MGTQTSRKLALQVVLFGYFDHRVGQAVPFGFAMKHDGQIAVHHRTDVLSSNLPDLFAFTVKNLPKIILAEWEKADQGAREKELHEFLCESTFHTVGNLRCWQPMSSECSVEEYDGYISALRKLVDTSMAEYRSELSGYARECAPGWDRFPQPKHIEMPQLDASPA